MSVRRVAMIGSGETTPSLARVHRALLEALGEPPHWLPGLDLLSVAAGLRVAVIPHYDNADGGNHDTRFCYLGERRLLALEKQLPDDAFVLGIDGHTALILDLEAATASVTGS